MKFLSGICKRSTLTFVCFLILFFTSAVRTQHVDELRAVKLTLAGSNLLYNDSAIAEAMDYLASIGVNMVLPVVWARGYTMYPSDVMHNVFGKRIFPDFSGRDPLERIIIEAHRNGIEVLPWFEYGFAASFGQLGGHILQKFPEWALHDREGKVLVKNGFDWMSGINPDVQDFIISLVVEVLDNYDVDGIEFSDRMPAMPVEGGYDSVTVALYQSEHNGEAPPDNYADPGWMRWRADQLNRFYGRVRDSVKVRGEYLINASSPNVYPWGYSEYLQDSKTWITDGTIDHLIPQWYRYSLPEYTYEVEQTLFHTPPEKHHKIYAGMLMKYGEYLISPDFLLDSIEAHRSRGVRGEAYFYYVGLRDNNNFLGDLLAERLYTDPAIVPDREGKIWRHNALIVNEDDKEAVVNGAWREMEFPSMGYRPHFLRADGKDFAEIKYSFDIAMSGWYGVYAYIIRSIANTTKAPFTVYSEGDSVTYFVDQHSVHRDGWQKITDVYLEPGYQSVVRLSTEGIEENKSITADAAMLMLNRQLSPDVIVTVEDESFGAGNPPGPESFHLYPNYPNPFNPVTNIRFSIPRQDHVVLSVYNLLGQRVDQLVDNVLKAGTHEVKFNASHLPSGVYMYRLQAGRYIESKKILYLK